MLPGFGQLNGWKDTANFVSANKNVVSSGLSILEKSVRGDSVNSMDWMSLAASTISTGNLTSESGVINWGEVAEFGLKTVGLSLVVAHNRGSEAGFKFFESQAGRAAGAIANVKFKDDIARAQSVIDDAFGDVKPPANTDVMKQNASAAEKAKAQEDKIEQQRQELRQQKEVASQKLQAEERRLSQGKQQQTAQAEMAKVVGYQKTKYGTYEVEMSDGSTQMAMSQSEVAEMMRSEIRTKQFDTHEEQLDNYRQAADKSVAEYEAFERTRPKPVPVTSEDSTIIGVFGKGGGETGRLLARTVTFAAAAVGSGIDKAHSLYTGQYESGVADFIFASTEQYVGSESPAARAYALDKNATTLQKVVYALPQVVASVLIKKPLAGAALSSAMTVTNTGSSLIDQGVDAGTAGLVSVAEAGVNLAASLIPNDKNLLTQTLVSSSVNVIAGGVNDATKSIVLSNSKPEVAKQFEFSGSGERRLIDGIVGAVTPSVLRGIDAGAQVKPASGGWESAKGAVGNVPDSDVLREIGRRGQRNSDALTPAQETQLYKHVEELGLDPADFQISSGFSAYSDNFDTVFLGPNMFPASERTTRSVFETLTPRVGVAHEAGHMITTRNGTAFEAGSLFDEVGASLTGRELPGLSNVERYQLLRDAAERSRNEGRVLRDVLTEMGGN